MTAYINLGGLDSFLNNFINNIRNDTLNAVDEVINGMVLPQLTSTFLDSQVAYPTKVGRIIDSSPAPTYGRISTWITYNPTYRLISSLKKEILSEDEIVVGSDIDYAFYQEVGWRTPSGSFFPGKHYFEKTTDDYEKFVTEMVDKIFYSLEEY